MHASIDYKLCSSRNVSQDMVSLTLSKYIMLTKHTASEFMMP